MALILKPNTHKNRQFSFFGPFRWHLASKWVKNGNKTFEKVFGKISRGISKNAKFYADFQSCEKVKKDYP
jgi:hypothetical protein